MLDSKQRAKLRAMASGLEPWFQIGKGGINDNMIADISAALEAHELVKISVLRTADGSAKELMAELSAALGAEQVAAIGSKIVLYRRSTREGATHIEL